MIVAFKVLLNHDIRRRVKKATSYFLLLSHNPKLFTSSTAEIHFFGGVCWVQKKQKQQKEKN